MFRKKQGCLFLLLLSIFCIAGCGRKGVDESAALETGDTVAQLASAETDHSLKNTEEDTAHENIAPATPTLSDVMDRILTEQGLDHALAYEDAAKKDAEDALVLLCTSESGQYVTYGFVSPEYGRMGILLNNIINGEDNWNYLTESWTYDDTIPSLKEQGEYEVLFSFPSNEDGKEAPREIVFDTYDTGTMSERE